ncbi:hypothetical protein C2S51_005887 [Perilla frutescens var. frutescens]|nr:hypothetical protein C2S51_005887 [Perilla frutescens var. frutescens]
MSMIPIRQSAWHILALVLVVNVAGTRAQQLSPSQCQEERRLATNMCRPMVFGQAASPACCQRVRISHFECVCPMFTPKLISILDINKVIKLFQHCGRRVPRRFKCGSLNFP